MAETLPDADAKPLHVRVAEALGWSAFLSKHGHFIVTHGEDPRGESERGTSCEYSYGNYNSYVYDPHTGKKLPERTDWWEDCPHVPQFDTDWAATGPLIEKLKIDLGPINAMREWRAVSMLPENDEYWTGPTPLIAVCNLILKLAEAGRLPGLVNG